VTPDAPGRFLAAGEMVDSGHPQVQDFARRHAVGATDVERAVALYYAVRDGFRYDPYRIDLSVAGMRGSAVLANGYGWCVTKAALLAAAARAAGIPARLGFADVRNHLSTERMRQTMTTDVFVWHGYTELWLEDAWRKATPAFNIELCDRFGLLPLEFDGRSDSIYHPFDRAGNRHMEYLRERGSHADIPLGQLVADFRTVYPQWLKSGDTSELAQADFLADVAHEPPPSSPAS
jgi:transglutaminase-like putative cysteine protease